MVGVGALFLAACEENGEFNLFQKGGQEAETDGNDRSVRMVERDVEAPDVFQITDMGLWDGRPSLGGVWIAHPEVDEPERVIIRNTENSNFVIGALFRRERENPGPVLQVSSDAAEALGMLAGDPAELNVTALRREAAPEDPEDSTAEGEETPTEDLEAADSVETTTLDPLAGAADAIDEADGTAEAETESAPDPEPAAESTDPPSAESTALDKPFIQIGIFSVEENADNTATSMRQAGMVPTVKKQTSQGKTFWRVIVGPARSEAERGDLLEKISGIGFEDAYAVTN